MKVLTKSEVIAEEIRNMIYGGEFPVGTSLPPERRLAERFASSQVTINKAISFLVSEGLIEKRHGSGNFVMEAVKTRKIAYIIDQEGDSMMLNPVWFAVFETFSVLAQQQNIAIETTFVGSSQDEIPPEVGHDVELIVASLALNATRVKNILNFDKPVVWLDQYEQELPGHSVYFDWESAGCVIANHLLEMDCHKILYVTFPMSVEKDGFEYVPSRKVFKGIKKGIERDGTGNCSLHYYSCYYDRDNFDGDIQNYISGQNSVDGIICFAEEFMPYILKVANGCGKKIPEELALAGFGVGNEMFCNSFHPSLTTVKQPLKTFGEECFQTVFNILESREVPAVKLITPEFTIRGSSKRCPS